MEKKHRVIKLSKKYSKDISALFKEVWLKSFEYPEEWRKKRAMEEEEIREEMDSGYYFFGVRIGSRLVGVYKASLTERGCFGEQQVVLREYRDQGVASAMYEQFIEFAKANRCKANYVNILVNDKICEYVMERYGFYKIGELWEQSNGMLVQTYERKCEEGEKEGRE